MNILRVLNPKYFLINLKLVIASMVSVFIRKRHPQIWLVAERPSQARDNGYCFFKYMREKHPECPVYYIISKNAHDRKKIEHLGNIIDYGSFRHFVYYCASKIHISAHDDFCSPGPTPIIRYIRKWFGIKNVFLPHGVSYGISDFVLAKYGKIDLFICSGKLEYENILTNYGYSQNQVAYTGFPRLDGWHDAVVVPRQIVVMPTWRAYLSQNPHTVIEDTKYFKTWTSFLNNSELNKLLRNSDSHLIFYLHEGMRKYVDSFRTSSENIEIVYDDRKYDIQELLKSSALLITDYSSVHFDFAYMRKPVIYYQFDRDEFLQRQYQSGLFDVKRDGFGPLACDETTLISHVCRVIKESFVMEAEFYDRMRNFYVLHDKKNCRRVWEVITNL